MRPAALLLLTLVFASVGAGGGGLTGPAAAPALAEGAGASDDEYQGLPDGPGRDTVFGLCQACHSLAIVKQQGLSRHSWDETLEWMVEEQGMPELEAEERDRVIDYLATFYGVDRRAAGGTGAGGTGAGGGMAPIAPPPR